MKRYMVHGNRVLFLEPSLTALASAPAKTLLRSTQPEAGERQGLFPTATPEKGGSGGKASSALVNFPTASPRKRATEKKSHPKHIGKGSRASFVLSKWGGQVHQERTGRPTGAPAAPQGSESQAGVGGGREGKRGGGRPGGPAAHLVKLRLGRNPQLRVYGALQRLDDPVEVHVPGRGLRPQDQQAGLQSGCLLDPLGPVRLPHPQPRPPTPPPAATCCATLTPRPPSSLLPPHSSLSIHPLRQPVGGGRRGSGDCFTTASSPWRAERGPALAGGAMMLYGKRSRLAVGLAERYCSCRKLSGFGGKGALICFTR